MGLEGDRTPETGGRGRPLVSRDDFVGDVAVAVVEEECAAPEEWCRRWWDVVLVWVWEVVEVGDSGSGGTGGSVDGVKSGDDEGGG